MSSELPGSVARVGLALQRYQSAVDDFDRESARLLGINETDLRCLEVLLQELPEAAPSQLAERLGMATGSVTAMLDRLEKLGYLTRSPHPTDRRKTLIRATPEVTQRAYQLIDPLLTDGAHQLLPRYTDDQIEVITDFLDHARDLQLRHVQRLRALPTPHKPHPHDHQPTEPAPATINPARPS